MLTKANGFTLIEVLFASGILFSFITIFIPITSKIQAEQQILIEKRNVGYILHEELQTFLWTSDDSLPAKYSKTVEKKEVQFQFIKEAEFIKGCANWNDANSESKTFCLYGIPKE